MIINDLQRLRWQILDEALRDPVTEYFMGVRTKTNETGNTRSLIYHVNQKLKSYNKDWSCSKRMLQNDVNYFQEKGARLEPKFRRGHKRILRYINLQWKNPLLRPAKSLNPAPCEAVAPLALPQGKASKVSLRIAEKKEETVLQRLCSPEIMQRQTDVQLGTVTVQVEIPVSEGLTSILLSFGADVEVLAPATLRDTLRHAITAMSKLYKKEVTKKEPQQQSLFGDLFE